MSWRVLVGMLVLLGVWSLGASAQETKEKPVTEQILDLLRQRGQITEEEYKVLKEKARQEQAAMPLVGIERGRPFFRSPDDNFRIELGGRLQVDYDAAEGDARTLTGMKLGNQFLVRRARLIVNGRFFQWIDFKIETDFTDSSPLRDVYLDFGFLPELRLRGGQFKEPFSLEELTSDDFIDFVERSLVNELAPSFDIGAMVYGSLAQGAVSYFLGGFNGAGQNVSDTNPDKDLAARFVFAPFKASDDFWLKGFQIAGNVTWGNQDSFPSAANFPNFRRDRGRTSARTPNRFEFFSPQPSRGNRTRFGGDLAWLIGPAALKFEYDEEIDHRDGQGPGGSNLDSVRAKGWYVSGTYVLTGENKPLNGPVVPRSPFTPLPGKIGPGAWEVGIRFAELKFSSDDPVNFFNPNLPQIPGGGRTAENGARALTLGVNWYLNERVRTMFNWTNNWFDNSLGTPFSCKLGSCTAANLRSGDKSSWEILSRIQVWF